MTREDRAFALAAQNGYTRAEWDDPENANMRDDYLDAACRHCGKPSETDGDHSCPCPYSDDACPDHPLFERTRLIREQQRDPAEEITAIMVSGGDTSRDWLCHECKKKPDAPHRPWCSRA